MQKLTEVILTVGHMVFVLLITEGEPDLALFPTKGASAMALLSY